MSGERTSLPPLTRSLSARLLLLTVGFVMLAEVLIYAPSIGRFRLSYFEERIAAGHLAMLALQATPDYMVSEALQQELLDHARAYAIGLKRPEGVRLRLGEGPVPPLDAQFDLRQTTFFSLIGEAFSTLAQTDNRVLRVVGPSPRHPQAIVEIVFDEAPMRRAMIDFSKRILGLSVAISLITAALVFLSIQWLLVRPMRRLTLNMTAFRDAPEDARSVIVPGTRRDELGVAERELSRLQQALRAALHQKTRLAALGTAVSKINHDLRNMLSAARLVSDRLARSDDPQVKQLSPTLLAAIDRAVKLCTDVLGFAGEAPPPLTLSRFALAPLVAEVGGSLPALGDGKCLWVSTVADGIELEADRDQLFRVLANLGQNAYQAGATRVEIAAERQGARLAVEVADNGPGLAPRARDKLFQPFAGSARPGGTGLGLAIARDLMQAHGGDIRLLRSTGEGTAFRLELPAARTPA